ncbi:MAG: hypothetical protein A2169_11285 [Deltaproteobacteria bacterium RBG_13_47_9]|nr:MAG: hypothetical protein A2169_11285 [Deltaproteobacteria bacterium RBG_13_47_9]
MQVNHFLEPLINPQSIAVIGAGDNPLKINGRALMFMLRHKSPARLFPVNPTRDTVQGVPCYRHISDLPEVPDAALIIVAKNLVLETIEELGNKGCRFAIVLASGYAETGEAGKTDQERLVQKAREHGMRLVGPNCMGLINVRKPAILSFCATLEREPTELLKGDVAMISQSGALLGSIWDMALGHGLGYSILVSTGNEADLEITDFIEYFVQDPNTRLITAYIEGLRNPAKFVQAVDMAHHHNKPVVVYKVGRTKEGARAAASHTGSLTGTDATFDAICRGHGIIRVDNLNALATTAIALTSQPPAKGSRLGIFSSSGGAAGVISDQLSEGGLTLAQPGPEFEREMTEILKFGPPHNPLDIGRGIMSTFDVITTAMERFVREDSFDQIIILMTMLYFIKVAPTFLLEGLKNRPEKPVLACWIGDKIADIPRLEMIRGGIPAFRDIEPCIDAAKALAALGKYRLRLAKGEKPVQAPPGARERSLKIIERCGRQMDEASSKEIFSLYGLPIPPGKVANSIHEAREISTEIGFPLAVKGLSPEVLHKSEAGAVQLNINNEKELEKAFEQVSMAVTKQDRGNSFRGIFIERMCPNPLAEVILGSAGDKFGFHTIMFGLGGIWVEVLEDTTFRLVPLLRQDAEEMIEEIRGRKILDGIRGKPPADKEGIVQAILALSALTSDLQDQIREIDVNPLLVYSKGVVAVDALIRLY